MLQPFGWVNAVGESGYQGGSAAFDAERAEPAIGAFTAGAVSIQGDDGRHGV